MGRFGMREDVSSESSESDFLDATSEPEPWTLNRAENAAMSEERLANMEAQLAAAMAEIGRLRAAPAAPAAMAVDGGDADGGAGCKPSDFRLPREFVDFLLSDGSNTALWRIRLTAVCQQLNCMPYLELPNMGVQRNVDGMVISTHWRVRAVRALLISSIKTEALIHLASTLRARNPGFDAMLTDVHPNLIYQYIIDAWKERSVGAKHDLLSQLQGFEMFRNEAIGLAMDRLMTLWGDLTIAGCEPTEMSIVDAAIRATRKHAEYGTVAAVLENIPNLTFNNVKIKLIAWEARLKSHAMDAPVRANPSSLALALPAPASSPDPMAAMMATLAEMMDAKLNAFSHHGGGGGRGRGNGRGRGRGNGRGNGMQGVQCYNCKGYGHMQNACPHPRN
jgi:hypothetical protein